MSTSKHTEAQSNHSKKETRKEIGLQLATALNNLKETLGEKKFERRIKKAARLLTAGIKTKPAKKEKKGKGKTKTNQSNKTKKAVAPKAVAE
jgi:HD-like signal output (HDOD) protein